MRFGTRTELGRRWTVSGYRPRGEQRIGYEYGYLSVAINPQTGDMKMLILPDMRVESFQAFIEEFQRNEDGEVWLITDGAASHRSRRLEIGEKLKLESLPAYSPELNPVERFFKELRKALKNRVFDSYEEVEEAVIKAAKPYLKEKERVKRLTGYSWLYTSPT